MPRPLTPAEIESLALRVSVRRIAVENFLSSMPVDIPQWQNVANLRADAKSYRWNEPTVRAIMTGIQMAYSRAEENPKIWQSGQDVLPEGAREYRKRTTIRAIQMSESFEVMTYEGLVRGKAGDWLAIGPKGDLYPIREDIFRETYEQVPDEYQCPECNAPTTYNAKSCLKCGVEF